MAERRPIYKWPRSQRPRERALDAGLSALSDAELLAVIIGKGTQEKSAVQLGEELISRFGSLKALSVRSLEELMTVPGIGRAKAVAIAAAFEMGRRASDQAMEETPVIRSPVDVFRYMREKVVHFSRETFWVLLLTTRGKVIRAVKISEGTLNSTLVHPREVFRPAVVENAASVILVHNHPGGDPTPSEDDRAVTRQLVRAGEIFSIPVIDHVIVASRGYFSMREKGEVFA